MDTSMDCRWCLVGMTGTATLTFDGPRWTEICGSATQLLSSFEDTWKMSMTSLRSALLLRAQRPILVLQMPSLAMIILAFNWSWRVVDSSSDWDAHSDKVNARRCSWLSCPISHPGATQIPAVMFLWRLSRCLISTSLFHYPRNGWRIFGVVLDVSCMPSFYLLYIHLLWFSCFCSLELFVKNQGCSSLDF